MTRRAVIIVAGGSGSRMGASIPKQFLLLGGRPILLRTVELFAQIADMQIVLVLPATHIAYWQQICSEYQTTAQVTVTQGGKTRHESVSNGLRLVGGDCIIGIHDGVRPLVSTETIERCYAEAEEHGTAVPVLPSIESVRIISPDGQSTAVDRSTIMLVQTPQVFRSDILRRAYALPYSPAFTDDASVVEALGEKIHLCKGNTGNIKITTPTDLQMAESIVGQSL